MRMVWITGMLVAALGMTPACSSTLSQVQGDIKGVFGANDYDVAKAEVWPPGKGSESSEGVTPAMKESCYVNGQLTDVVGKRCYTFYGGTLHNRQATYVKSAADAVSMYESLVADLGGDYAIVFAHGPETEASSGLRCALKSSGGKYTPYAVGSKVLASFGDAGAAVALKAGTLCAQTAKLRNGKTVSVVRLGSAGDGKYAVSYTDFSSAPGAVAAEKAYRKSLIEQIEASKRALSTGPGIPVPCDQAKRCLDALAVETPAIAKIWQLLAASLQSDRAAAVRACQKVLDAHRTKPGRPVECK